MYRVVLVDNEPWILQGMEMLMPWQAHGFSVMGAFTDPVEAFEAICADPPDLVVIDIRMPEMDGLTLLHRARERSVASEFIIVSGYAEFEYAQRAMPGQVWDYLLKPVEPDEMGAVLARLSASLTARLDRERRKATALLSEQKDFRLLFTDISHTHYLCARIRGVEVGLLAQTLPDCAPPDFKLFAEGADGAWAVFANGIAIPEEAEAALRGALADMPEARVGISLPTTNPMGLPTALREAEASAHRDFIDPDARLTHYKPARGGSLERIAFDTAMFFVLRQQDRLTETLRAMMEQARASGVGLDAIADFWNRLTSLINTGRAEEAHQREMQTLTPAAMAAHFSTLHALCVYLEGFLGGIIREGLRTPREENGDERFYDLLDEVSARYAHRLSLQALAKSHHMNVSYCCKLFNRITGGTFSDCLIRLRLEHARSAMTLMGLPAERVYRLVGYSDPYYFRRSYQKYFSESFE